MTSKDLIESGIVELYCLGIASDDEKLLVEEIAAVDQSLREEIAAVNDALAKYAVAASSSASKEKLKEKIFASINATEMLQANRHFPPVLDKASTCSEWLSYLDEHHIAPTEQSNGLEMIELPGNTDYYTYVVFGNPGDVVAEEVHNGHNEYLLICAGECEMMIDGKTSYHKAGDFICVTPGIRHSGIIRGSESMIVIGQRRAA